MVYAGAGRKEMSRPRQFRMVPADSFLRLWMLFADGENGPNEYGPNPKGQGNYNSINEIGKKEA
ncbi:hypothetical protein CHA01nite_19590 [Chryseobacterium hagamense]|uniref:Uncharacterized protein n=1 Tax=Chryseobacterium hagamense TaxID=395935 RepID=A0A511YLZ3_9FLAO|nr:hypothetical protein CHA01nite_19590 [Chryseobacterium hagamense]